jgi:predicted nucleotidyltransferase
MKVSLIYGNGRAGIRGVVERIKYEKRLVVGTTNEGC